MRSQERVIIAGPGPVNEVGTGRVSLHSARSRDQYPVAIAPGTDLINVEGLSL
jgi:hypothetical protein